MVKIRRLPVGQLKTNCYLVWDEGSLQALIVDPGDDADYIMRIIADENIKPVSIVATHGHFDHIMAVNELKLAFDIPFLANKDDEFLIKRLRKTAGHFAGIDPGPPPKIDTYINEGDKIKVGKQVFKVINIPGHTPGGIGLYNAGNKILFVGDLIFAGGGVGRVDFSYSSMEKLVESIKKVFLLPDETKIFCGHGDESLLESERQNLSEFLN